MVEVRTKYALLNSLKEQQNKHVICKYVYVCVCGFISNSYVSAPERHPFTPLLEAELHMVSCNLK